MPPDPSPEKSLSALLVPDLYLHHYWRELAECRTEVILRLIFDEGFFHTDLHPGSLCIEAKGRGHLQLT